MNAAVQRVSAVPGFRASTADQMGRSFSDAVVLGEHKSLFTSHRSIRLHMMHSSSPSISAKKSSKLNFIFYDLLLALYNSQRILWGDKRQILLSMTCPIGISLLPIVTPPRPAQDGVESSFF